MYCPRLDHFVRLNSNGSVSRCGHMIDNKSFKDYESLEGSEWLSNIKKKMEYNQWPSECIRCQQSEHTKSESVRTNSIARDKILKSLRDDYLVVGGVLDNVCNSACQTCNANLSTKIGALEHGKDYPRIDNYELFKKLPQDRIVEFDVNGGEPTASKNYKSYLKELPKNVKIVRMNTNGSRVIEEIIDILDKGTMVIITFSLDGIGSVHDYVRWPILWSKYIQNLQVYKDIQKKYKLLKIDMWTTVSCFNISDLPNIIKFAKDQGIPHDWAYLRNPSVLSVRHKNRFTSNAHSFDSKHIAVGDDNSEELDAFIKRQDRVRGIDINDYLNLLPN